MTTCTSTTHYAGCECHEARHAREIARLIAQRDYWHRFADARTERILALQNERTKEAEPDIHSCSYHCERPECIKRQRDELRDAQTVYVEPDPAPDCPCCTGTGKAPYTDPHLDIAQPADAREAKLYDELLYAVCTKCPGETRHQTALRYIRQAEAPTGEVDQAAIAAIHREEGE